MYGLLTPRPHNFQKTVRTATVFPLKVEVKRREKGEAFGENIPQEPLARVGDQNSAAEDCLDGSVGESVLPLNCA